MSKDIFPCGCCGEIFPMAYINIHHKIPKSVGGTNAPENLIELCPGCHDALHSIAYKLLNPKFPRGKIVDLVNIIYKSNTKAQKICLELANKVRDAVALCKEEGVDPDQLVALTTTIRKADKDFLAVYCRDRQMSQEDFLRTLVLKELLRMRGKPLSDLPQEHMRIKWLKRVKETH